MDEPLRELESGTIHRFSDWPNAAVPNWRAGVYTVWRGDEFIYVGMSGRGLTSGAHLSPEATASSKPKGLVDRLRSHASGYRSGDQFCIYVADRLVLPMLSASDREGIAAGRLSFDFLVRSYIAEHLTYRFTVVDSGRDAYALERHIQSAGLGGQSPLFNGTAR